MKKQAFIVLIYGILVLIGGVIGFLKAKSIISLKTGLIFGIFIIGSSLVIFQKKMIGVYIALVLSFLLGTFFAFRYFFTQQFFPSAFMALLSAIVLIDLGLLLMRKKKS